MKRQESQDIFERGYDQPGDIYIKSRRWMIISSVVFILSVLGEISYAPDKVGLPIIITNPSLVNILLALAILYFTIQTLLFWTAQNQKVRNQWPYKFDLGLSLCVMGAAIIALLYKLGQAIIPTIDFGDKNETIWASMPLVIAVTLGSIISFILSYGLGKAFGKVLRRKAIDLAILEGAMIEALYQSKWILIFSPSSEGGYKKISFNADGTIGIGRNHNEHTWRQSGEFIEILNDDGLVFSRFYYEPNEGYFQHTNDSDTLSIPNQLIIREENLDAWKTWLKHYEIEKSPPKKKKAHKPQSGDPLSKIHS